MIPRSAAFSLAPDEVNVWVFSTDISSDFCRPYRELLSTDERARADKFRFESDRIRFTVSRASLRMRLGACCGTRPETLVFGAGVHGKPSLLFPEVPIQFNVSHSGCRGVIAVTSSRRCGIDIEKVRHDVSAQDIAAGYFCGRENEWLQASPEMRVRGFFRMWVLKEAILKAHGKGLSIPLADIDTTYVLDGKTSTVSLHDSENRILSLWTAELDLADGYASAIAVEGTVPKVRIFQED